MNMQEKCAIPDAEAADAAAKTTAEMVFVSGDRGAGLVIVGLGNTRHRFRHGGIDIEAHLETTIDSTGIFAQTLHLDMERPTRFRIEWLIPDSAMNAAMTLNGGLLIGPFAAAWPSGGPRLPTPACGNDTPVSTLQPGHFQAIDFAWEGGDALILYLALRTD